MNSVRLLTSSSDNSEIEEENRDLAVVRSSDSVGWGVFGGVTATSLAFLPLFFFGSESSYKCYLMVIPWSLPFFFGFGPRFFSSFGGGRTTNEKLQFYF
jgi:hypothetical protein